MSPISTFVRSIYLYGGLPIFICGTFGHLINICCFWRTRRNPCGFLFIILSCVNMLTLFYGLFIRILIIGFDEDWSNTNVTWCKVRLALSPSFTFVSLSCTCLASIDRYFASCRQQSLRQFSRLSVAKTAMIVVTVFWLCHSIPYFIYGNLFVNPITGIVSCTLNLNNPFANYQAYIVFPIYIGLLPCSILIITGLMTIYNTSKLQLIRHRQRIQRQLTLMMLVQIPIIILSIFPYAIFMEYTIFTVNVFKSIDQRNNESIILNVMTLMLYIAFSCQFFVFFISSAAFREEMKSLLLFRRQNWLRHSRIQPFITTSKQNSNDITT